MFPDSTVTFLYKTKNQNFFQLHSSPRQLLHKAHKEILFLTAIKINNYSLLSRENENIKLTTIVPSSDTKWDQSDYLLIIICVLNLLTEHILFLHPVDMADQVPAVLLHVVSQREWHFVINKVDLGQVGKSHNVQLQHTFVSPLVFRTTQTTTK